MNPRATTHLMPYPRALGTRRTRPRPEPSHAPVRPVAAPSWPSVVGSACRRHLADVCILLCTALFVVLTAAVGLLLIRGG